MQTSHPNSCLPLGIPISMTHNNSLFWGLMSSCLTHCVTWREILVCRYGVITSSKEYYQMRYKSIELCYQKAVLKCTMFGIGPLFMATPDHVSWCCLLCAIINSSPAVIKQSRFGVQVHFRTHSEHSLLSCSMYNYTTVYAPAHLSNWSHMYIELSQQLVWCMWSLILV